MLKTIVLKQKQEKETFLQNNYIKRNKDEFGRKWIDSKLIKVVLGPRRAGKSIFCFMLLKDRPFMYFNFDDEVLANIKNVSTDALIKELHAVYGNTKNIFFDKIQNLPNWELFVNRLQREGYNLVITGSNAKLLSRELATALTGRHVPIEIFPFDFNEFLRAKKIKIDNEFVSLPKKRGQLLNLLNEYLLSGGFPETVMHVIDTKYYLKILFDSLLFKDVVKRHRVKFSDQIINLSSYLVDNFTSFYSLRKLQKMLNLKSVSTIEKYIGYLEESYLLFSLFRYSSKFSQRIKSPKKIYVADNGFIQAKAIQHSKDTGRLMENLVFIELVKRGMKPNTDFFYYKTKRDKEIDFVVKEGVGIKELIQVCYDISDIYVEKREVGALLEASKELKASKFTILTWDKSKKVEEDGVVIDFIPLLDWFMNTN